MRSHCARSNPTASVNAAGCIVVARCCLAAVGCIAATGCAEGRGLGDASRPVRDDALSMDATLVFPDVVVLDAFSDDTAGHATDHDALSSPTDARGSDAPIVDAFVAPDVGRDGGTDASCACMAGSRCTTTCGSMGTLSCAMPCAPVCMPPAETCNAADDDCDGTCDEDVVGCRGAVIRAYHDTRGNHLYTQDRALITREGFRIEADPYFFVYRSPAPGLVPFHQCHLSGTHRLYTIDPSCESSGASYEGVLGYVAPAPLCGARPLYRLSTPTNHFYTIDSDEREFAVRIGYTDEGIAAYVW